MSDTVPSEAATAQPEVTDELVGDTSGTCGENVTWVLNGDTLTISGTGNMRYYSCDAAYRSPWYRNSAIKKIVIEDGVTSIGSCAFYGCTGVTSVTVPASVTDIENGVFSECTGLKTAGPVGGGYNYEFGWTTSIPSYAFCDCSALTDITIPTGVTYIGGSAFHGCSSVTGITIPSGVTNIERETFSGCSSLKNITIPSGVTSIGAEAFYGCSSLSDIVIPAGVTQIEQKTFYGCSGLKSVSLPSGLTAIGCDAFEDCSGLTEIVIPSGVTSIESWVFYDCSGLTKVSIPSGVTFIEDSAFGRCSSLTEIDIPSGVTYIGSQAFYDCSALTGIVIPSRITTIEEGTFYGCSGLTAIDIPAGVTSIGKSAFQECSALTEITIPSGVTSIQGATFADCSGLKSISIPSGVTSIGASAFDDCSALTEVTVPGGVTSIEKRTFNGCSSLKSVSLPSGITSIGDRAFYNCSELTDFTFPSGLTSIGENAFFGCNGFVRIELPSGLKEIDDYAFFSCLGLRIVTIPSSVNSVGKSIFECCYPGKITIPYAGMVTLDGSWINDATGATVSGDELPAGSCTRIMSVKLDDTDQSVVWGQPYGELPVPEREGYTFDGWYTEWDGGDRVTSATTVSAVSDHTLYSRWTANSYKHTLYYDANGGTGAPSPQTETIVYPGEVSQFVVSDKIPVRAGYTFDGWYTDAESGMKYEAGSKIWVGEFIKAADQSETLYAHWTENSGGNGDSGTTSFTDVSSTAYYAAAVDWAVSKSITTGTGNNRFSPGDSCPREQVVTFLWRAYGSPEPSTDACSFTDVAAGKYYYKAVLWAAEKGITKGINSTTFGTGRTVTRADFVTFLYRAQGSPDTSSATGFGDVNSSAYYAKPIAWAAGNGITTGTGNGCFSPAAPCTRGQVVTFLYRALK